MFHKNLRRLTVSWALHLYLSRIKSGVKDEIDSFTACYTCVLIVQRTYQFIRYYCYCLNLREAWSESHTQHHGSWFEGGVYYMQIQHTKDLSVSEINQCLQQLSLTTSQWNENPCQIAHLVLYSQLDFNNWLELQKH